MSEERLLASIDFYDYASCSHVLKNTSTFDVFLVANWTSPLALIFGSLEGLEVAYAKLLAAYKTFELAQTRNYGSEVSEIWGPIPPQGYFLKSTGIDVQYLFLQDLEGPYRIDLVSEGFSHPAADLVRASIAVSLGHPQCTGLRL